MSEWDFGDSGSGGFDNPGSSSGGSRFDTGGLNSAMSIVCLLAVTAVSFLVAWRMKDVVRNFWQMGLTFAAPFATLMVSSLLVERNTHLMTPSTSMGSQKLFALATVVVAFAVGCLTVLLHDPVTVTYGGSQYDYVLVIDKSYSMNRNNRNNACINAANQLINDMSNDTKVGIVAFDDEIRGTADILPLSTAHRNSISAVLSLSPNGNTDFDLALKEAMQLIDNMQNRNRPIRIIFISDGDDTEGSTCREFINWAQELNNQNTSFKQVELCAIQLDMEMPNTIKKAVNATGGVIKEKTTANQLASQLGEFKVSGGGSEDVDILKATYSGEADTEGKSNTTYKIMSAVLLLVLGLLTGFSLMIMFSARGQFRAQVIISAMVGIIAFLLLNFGKSIGLAPAWVCEAVAFSLFGLVFMKQNLGVSGSSGKIPAPAAASEFSSSSSGGFDDF